MFELQILFVLTCMFLIPGWFVLAITGIWRDWSGLQMWIVAVGIGIAFYPVLFYLSRAWLPILTFGPYKIGMLLMVMAIITILLLRLEWRRFFIFDRLEWVALLVFIFIGITRIWIIHQQPYPAWTDSLHHTLLTQLTAVQGQLPSTMDPYFPISLDQYHLGLYAITATLQWLAQVPAHTALLWTAQMLNALASVGVYLVLDRKVGRFEAIVGAVMVGLLFHQPAFYVNWGRFTQLASQTLMPIAWLLTWEAVAQGQRQKLYPIQYIGYMLIASLVTASVFLVHFRVAIFYLPLILGVVFLTMWKTRLQWQVFVSTTARIVLMGFFSLLFIASPLLDLIFSLLVKQSEQATSQMRGGDIATYYQFSLDSLPLLVASPWLMMAALISLLIGLLMRNKIALVSLLWIVSLLLIGHVYLLPYPVLHLTNLGAVLIMLYIPMSLAIGAAAGEILYLVKIEQQRRRVMWGVIGIVCLLGIWGGYQRVHALETYRYFVTPADVVAMDWIVENTPVDARFAINTHFWMSTAPHGTDGGYWIPYFTGRSTTAGMMNSSSGPPEHWKSILAMSQAVSKLLADPTAVADLRSLDIGYIYIGTRGDFASAGLNVEHLRQMEGLEQVYERDGVAIFKVD
jgi:hypothetical protein